jgi:hypothetical protein
MFSKLLSVAAGLALLVGVSAANAKQPLVMTDNQLDRVTAGVSFAEVSASAEGLSVNGSFNLSASNTSATAGSASAFITATATLVGIAPHTLSLFSFASAP